MDVQSMSLEFIDDASKSVEAEYREKNVSLIDETSLFIKLFDISAVKANQSIKRFIVFIFPDT